MNKNAFTLWEFLLVMLLMSLCAGIAYPNYRHAMKRHYLMQCHIAQLQAEQQCEKQYFNQSHRGEFHIHQEWQQPCLLANRHLQWDPQKPCVIFIKK